MSILKIKTIIFSLAFISPSCNKLVTVDKPINQLNSSTVFSNDANAVAAMSGLYASMAGNANSFISSSTSIFGGLSSDEFYNGAFATYEDFFRNSLNPATTALVSSIWTPAYNYIYQANAIIEGISNSKELTLSIANQIKGEALVVRAFCYFYLTNFFDGVPLILSTDYNTNSQKGRNSQAEIYQKIKEDLFDAQQLLTTTYPSSNRSRINRYAATALLARIHLYLRDWINAEKLSTSVINSTVYSLTNNTDSTFLLGTKEAIWQLLPTTATSNTAEGTQFVPANNAVPSYVLNTGLLASFSVSDRRKISWTKTTTVNGNLYSYPYKYKMRNGTANVQTTEYYIMLRLAEQYLIRAEAYAHMNDIDKAVVDIDRIRKRAGISTISGVYPGISQQGMIDSIATERRRELFAEWGHRWFDLKRTEKANLVLQELKPDWKPTAVFYPIPHAQILVNPQLAQNPGY